MYCENAISHCKSPKIFAPAAGSTMLCLHCKTLIHFFLLIQTLHFRVNFFLSCTVENSVKNKDSKKKLTQK